MACTASVAAGKSGSLIDTKNRSAARSTPGAAERSIDGMAAANVGVQLIQMRSTSGKRSPSVDGL